MTNINKRKEKLYEFLNSTEKDEIIIIVYLDERPIFSKKKSSKSENDNQSFLDEVEESADFPYKKGDLNSEDSFNTNDFEKILSDGHMIVSRKTTEGYSSIIVPQGKPFYNKFLAFIDYIGPERREKL